LPKMRGERCFRSVYEMRRLSAEAALVDHSGARDHHARCAWLRASGRRSSSRRCPRQLFCVGLVGIPVRASRLWVTNEITRTRMPLQCFRAPLALTGPNRQACLPGQLLSWGRSWPHFTGATMTIAIGRSFIFEALRGSQAAHSPITLQRERTKPRSQAVLQARPAQQRCG
jgi:hypothetical protein